MALKDWRKKNNYEWQNIKNKNIFINIQSFGLSKLDKSQDWYEIYYIDVEMMGHKQIGKEFKTKKQALIYAKNYMKKH